MGTILGVPFTGTIVFWGLYWVPLFWETAMVAAGRVVPEGLGDLVANPKAKRSYFVVR